ncbi:unnamed protein product [Rotaria socialis]|uniref:Fucosyltransferase n=2 Tax=Rotaria socialis TaxID=392032 RepID=A0A817TLD0_9BILA|nr:unnamed protein product [Rotaria socialis]CAF3322466.1 unnamed protein product [Rotaria socialis]CAF3687280.1 unnamed protein product [Rotaria socialis]CAF3726177.1 unnamed protein product [Rotaria socialis]
MHSSKQTSMLWLWWRRQSFYLRRISVTKTIFLLLCAIFLLRKLPNPFSSQYSRISINQDVQWDSISEILTMKKNMLLHDSLPRQVKVTKKGTEEPQSSSSSILILLYTSIFLQKRYCHVKSESIFGQSCPSKDRCQWTCDNRRLREADAIIFHAYDIQFYNAPVPNRSETKKGSVWILWSDEPPSMVDYGLLKPYKFNWTISYKSNSEVSIGSYGLFSKRDTRWSDVEYNQWIHEQFGYRPEGALWFVSNCNSKKRLEYYNSLTRQKLISVEGYGRCVDYYPMHFCGAGTECERDYMSKFKFYLSFESTTCRDYITEKFFKAFYHGLIPVVVGPDRIDYNRLAPNGSFIHVNDFGKDMTRLAEYLQDVSLNLKLFSKYHQWRQQYEIIIDGRALERVRMCELCERLRTRRRDDMIYYENIEQFYYEKC